MIRRGLVHGLSLVQWVKTPCQEVVTPWTREDPLDEREPLN